jgi:hypothetical protein
MPASNVLWPVPLQRLTPWYPGQMGVPGTDSDRGLRLDANGKILWVDPNHVDANDGRDGTDPDAPLATVAAALAKCRPYAGDVVAVAHNSLWTYADLTQGRVLPIQEAVVVTVPGVRLVGLAPSSSLGVPWVPTGAGATCLTIRAMDVIVEGFCFWNALLANTTGILAEWNAGSGYYGENTVIRHNAFYGLAYGVQLDYAWNCFVEDNIFQGCTTQAIHNPSVFGEPDYLAVRRNLFVNNTGAVNLPACQYEVIEDNAFLDNAVAIAVVDGSDNVIHGNRLQGDPAGAGNFIDIGTDATSLVSDNWLSCTLAQYAVTCVGGAGGAWVRNHCIDGETIADP